MARGITVMKLDAKMSFTIDGELEDHPIEYDGLAQVFEHDYASDIRYWWGLIEVVGKGLLPFASHDDRLGITLRLEDGRVGYARYLWHNGRSVQSALETESHMTVGFFGRRDFEDEAGS